MRIPAASRFTVTGLVVLALVSLAAVAGLSKPVTVAAGQQPQPWPPRVAAVNVGAWACPDPGAPGSQGAAVAVIAAAPRVGAGRLTIGRLTAAGRGSTSPLATISRPGTPFLTGIPVAAGSAGSPGGVMIQAVGSMAQGLAAEQVMGSGLVTTGCAAPSTDFWFAAPGQQAAGAIKLYLMNVDGLPSVVDVDIFTDTGPLQAGVDTGITVPPHGLVVQSLARLVHGSRAIGLLVQATAGRVVAALSESSSAGQAAGKAGSQPEQWLPAAQPPATRLMIPALPASAGTRLLYVADPGGSDAAVKLSVVTTGGTYQPTGTSAIDIPAGSASEIQLPSLSGVTGAAVLTSSVPVTAAVVVPGGTAGGPGAMTVAAPALQEQGVVADVGPPTDNATLVLSAPGRGARVRLAIGTAGLFAGGATASPGPVSVRLISVPAGRTVTVTLPRPARGHSPFALVLTPLPGSGPVYAGRVLAPARGAVLGILPVASALTSVPLPAVRESLITARP